jgi:iron complex transport system substrate-binding protein
MPKILSLIFLTAATLCLAACGSDDSGASGAQGSAAGGFPVAVSQALGEVTIEDRPQRVVALDYPSADAALALGVMPVGMYEVTYVDGGVQAWTRRVIDKLGGKPPELIDTETGFPFETLQRLRPDVILATNTYPLIEDSWDTLNAIAPVVGHVEGPGVDDWRQGVRQVARALGRESEGRRLIAGVDAEVARVREEHPEFESKTVSVFNYVAGDGLFVINAPDDASIQFFEQLGFAGLTDEVAGLEGQEGRAKVSPESYQLIDADVVVGTSPDPAKLDELERHSLFRGVPAIERGGFVGVEIGEGTAMAFPSVLSIPYANEQLSDRIAAAVTAGD